MGNFRNVELEGYSIYIIAQLKWWNLCVGHLNFKLGFEG